MVGIVQILKSLFLISAQADERDRDLYRQRQVSHHVVVGPHHQLGVGILRIQFEDPFVIAARAHCIAQSGKPGALDERGVKRELSAGDAAGIEHIYVVRIAREFGVFQFLGLLHQLLDALLLRRIGGTVR